MTSVVAVLFFVTPLGADAQTVEKVSRIGLLGLGAGAASPGFAALRQALRERGYVEGQNILIEDRSALGLYTELPYAAAALLRFKVDVIVTQGSTATQAARKATNANPIVMIAAAFDPREAGSGLTSVGHELYAKRLALLKEALPDVSRVATLLTPDSPPAILAFNDAQQAAYSDHHDRSVRPIVITCSVDRDRSSERSDDTRLSLVSVLLASCERLGPGGYRDSDPPVPSV